MNNLIVYQKTLGVYSYVFFSISIIFTVTLSNQPDPYLNMLGKILHVFNITYAIFISLYYFKIKIIPFIFALLFSFFYAKLYLYQDFYFVGLNLLFLISGMLLFKIYRKNLWIWIWFISVLSLVIALLQIIGVSEHFQYLATHGIIDDGETISKTPTFSLFEKSYDPNINFLQGRPAGIMHSNQFFSFFCVVAFSLCYCRNKTVGCLDILIVVLSVLTLSKAVLIVMLIVISCYPLLNRRFLKKSIKIISLFLLFIFMYWIFFPAFIEIFLLNPKNLYISFGVRIIDFLSSVMGWNETEINNFFLKYLALEYLINETSLKPNEIRNTIYTYANYNGTILSFDKEHMLIALVFAISLFPCFKIKYKSGRLNFRTLKQKSKYILPMIAIGLFSFSANYTQAYFFWYFLSYSFAGLTYRVLKIRSFSSIK